METAYWWFRGLHSILLDTLAHLKIDRNARLLDAGCGTGQNLVNIATNLECDVFGFDISPHAIPFWEQRVLRRNCLASVNEVPFRDGMFDVVVSVDLLECDEVDEHQALSELTRVIRPGGILVLVVPAYKWLMSPEHHKAVAASRRYTKTQLTTLVQRHNLEIIRMTSVFCALFPLIAAYRLALKSHSANNNNQPRSELKMLHPAINESLSTIMKIERQFLRRVNLPFGSSILTTARKIKH
jgi:ubiquinone/menaquinone biosynthesis C-methylase UbiE